MGIHNVICNQVNDRYITTGRGSTNFPENVSDVRYVALQGFNIAILETRTFRQLSNCRELYLEHNSIEEIKPGAFFRFAILIRLELNYNKLRYLRFSTFLGLRSLRVLSMDHNHISHIQDHTFHGLDKLDILYLHQNELKEIKDKMFSGLSSLKELHLEENQITTIGCPDVFSNISRPLTLAMTNQKQPMKCDNSVCWLARETNNGSILWAYKLPKCEGGISFENYNFGTDCLSEGNISRIQEIQ